MDNLDIHIQGLSHSYEEDVPAIHDITLDIPGNTFMGIVGQNGAGKTTLIKHLNGLLKPSQGAVNVAGMDTRNVSVATLARYVGYVFQNPDHQIFSATVSEEITFGLANLGTAPNIIKARLAAIMEEFALNPYAETPPAMLGFGLRRKVSLAAVLAMEPAILVLDEPTVGLDSVSTEEFFDHVTRLHQAGHTIILVTHDMQLVANYCQLCVVMQQGRVLACDDTHAIFRNAELVMRAGLALPPITALSRRLQDVGMPADRLSIGEFMSAFTALEKLP